MNYTKWLKWGVITGLCLTLFTVFIVADGTHFFGINMFFPYITGKNFTFRILVEILLALYVLLAIREPKYRPRSSLIMWAFGLFVLWMAAATFFSVDPIKSFWSNFERMDGYITLLHMFALFIVAGAVLTAEKWWEKFFQVSIAASILMGLYAVCQAFNIFGLTPSSQSGTRADTTFGNATYLAVYMLFNFFITLFLALRERKNKGSWWLYGPALALQFAALYFTETRGAMLGLIGGLVLAALYVALFSRDPKWRQVKKWSLWGIGAVVVVVALFIALRNTSFVQNSDTLQRFASISLTDRTTISRFTIWGEAWQGFKEKPVFGWGQENFNFVFNKFYNPSMFDQEQWFDRAHNEFVDWAVAGGLPAFALYLSLFALAAWVLFKSDLEVPEQAVFVGLLAGYAFNNLTVFDNLGSYLYFFLILAFVHGLSRKRPHGWLFLSKPLSDNMVAVAAPIVLVLLVWGGYELNGPAIARAQTLIDAITSVNLQTGAPKDPSANLAAFQTALNDGPLGRQETVEQLFQYSSNTVAPSQSISPDVKQQAYALTRQAADSLMAQRKGDARLELFYAVFLDQFGQYGDALQHLQSGLVDSPGKQQLLFQLGSTYLAQGNVKDGVPPFQQAFTEAPAYNQARILYASALYYAGQNAQADAVLTDGFGTVLVDDQSLMQTYFATKQYGRLAGIYAEELTKNPNDPQAGVGHAVASYFAGSETKAQAIAELNKVSSANPSVASQIQSIISQINNGTLKP